MLVCNVAKQSHRGDRDCDGEVEYSTYYGAALCDQHHRAADQWESDMGI